MQRMMQNETHQLCVVEVCSEHFIQVPIAAVVCMVVMGFAVSRDGFQGWQQSLCVLRRQTYVSQRCKVPQRTCQELALTCQLKS